MTITLISFLEQTISNPALFIINLLTLGVILVNGWTDAPNAIATCVSTRSMGPGSAILMAAVFNFLGVLIMTLINATVAQTIYRMVDFRGDPDTALVPYAQRCSPSLYGLPERGGSEYPPAKAMPLLQVSPEQPSPSREDWPASIPRSG